jgi:uncharacterized membrane protein
VSALTVDAPVEDERARASRLRLAGSLLFMGTLHFAVPKAFEKLIPSWLPRTPRFWTYLSGVWELTSGALLLSPRTKKAGGYAAAATIVAVFPGNIKMAIDAGPPRDVKSRGAWLRLPLQVPLLMWALKQTRA